MHRNTIGASGIRILLVIWGFGIAAMLGVVLVTDVRMALCVSNTVAHLQQPLQKEVVQFPCQVPGTALTVEYLAAYDGAYLEDGSDREMTGVMAAMLHNRSDREIGEATVTLQNEGQVLCFYAQCIPAGAKVLVLEQNGAAYVHTTYDACTGHVTQRHPNALTPQQLQIREADMGSLTVTNLTQMPMEQVILYYKTCSPDGSFYIGGITYSAVIENLAPSQTVRITPYHYAAGYSSVIKAILT